MYGTTIKSYNETKDAKFKKCKRDKAFYNSTENKKQNKKISKKHQDTKYMKIGTDSSKAEVEEIKTTQGFSIKELPIASVVVTVVLTMMLLVMMSGFGGL